MMYHFFFLLLFLSAQIAHTASTKLQLPSHLVLVGTDYDYEEQPPRNWPSDLSFKPSNYSGLRPKIAIRPDLALQIQDIPSKGKGVVATKVIPKNTFVGEYTGKKIIRHRNDVTPVIYGAYLASISTFPRDQDPSKMTVEEITRIVDTTTQDDAVCIFQTQQMNALKTHPRFAPTADKNAQPICLDPWELGIDGQDIGNQNRFFNHSARHCNLKQYTHPTQPRIYLVTTQEIRPDQELLCNYGQAYWNTLGIEPVE